MTTMEAELGSARALLETAGVTFTHAGIETWPPMPTAVADLFGWTIREGTTNVIRHSDATWCDLEIDSADGQLRVRLTNDAAHRGTTGKGSGLPGLADRARPIGGTATGADAGDGRFELTVTVPWSNR